MAGPQRKKSTKRSGSTSPEGASIKHQAVKRLLLRAGLKRVKNSVCGVVSSLAVDSLKTLLHRAVLNSSLRGSKTIMEPDIHNAASALGFGVAVGINPSTKILSLKTGPSSAPSSGATKRKAKHGVVTARQVRFQQRNSNSFVFQKKNFLGMVKAIVRDPSAMNFMFGTVDLENIRFSKNVINMIQLIIESYLLAVCSSARTVVEGMGQKTVSEAHFKVVLQVFVASATYSRFIQDANLEFNSTISHSTSARRPATQKPKKKAPKKAAPAKAEKTKAKGKAPAKKAAADKPKAKAKGKGKGGKKPAPKAPAKKGMKLKK